MIKYRPISTFMLVVVYDEMVGGCDNWNWVILTFLEFSHEILLINFPNEPQVTRSSGLKLTYLKSTKHCRGVDISVGRSKRAVRAICNIPSRGCYRTLMIILRAPGLRREVAANIFISISWDMSPAYGRPQNLSTPSGIRIRIRNSGSVGRACEW